MTLTNRSRILLVDDEPGLRHCLAKMLGSEQYQVVEAESAATALGLFTPTTFDLIITDYSMPHMDGGEFAARIKHLAPRQPVMMITGSREKLPDSGLQVDAVLDKPFKLADLLRAISDLIPAKDDTGDPG